MDLPRIPLILAPTPLHRLPRLSKQLGVDLWIKRDDLTGFAGGGNKGRKLEYILADALTSGADTIVTCGSRQSNFVRQLGAACSVAGLSCHAAVMDLPYLGLRERPTANGLRADGGNVLLDGLFGVDLRTYPDGTWDDLYDHTKRLAEELRACGQNVYEVPVGGSAAPGAFGFAKAGEELKAQAPSNGFDWIVFASSSGSTQTGLTYSFHGSKTEILGIACDPEPDIIDDFQALYGELEALAGERRPIERGQWRISFDFVGPGYGVPSEAGMDAIRLMARSEGILLDPIYTGKAFSGLLTLARAGELKGRVLFWHTGGIPALYSLPEGC